MNEWIRTESLLPEENKVVLVQTSSGNESKLYRYKNLWFIPDGSTYVYYAPVKWKEL